ncbi:MAG: pyridoxine 5'-phosphate synthase [Bacteroidales bacterium]|nr:pyridoxine 5'-phosphate synthase [Bacteroidales bacterium]
MVKLSVNINKIATIRNARGGNIPDVLKAALNCEKYGAEGITVHPRPDERHIRYSDVRELKPHLKTEFNIEGYPGISFLQLVKEVEPTQVTLVPDPPHALTSDHGWNTVENKDLLKTVVEDLKSHGIRTSIFIDPDENLIKHAKDTGVDRVELYTESYASNYVHDKAKAIAPFIKAAEAANQAGLGLNAGHDLNLDNLKYFIDNISGLQEVSIGDALVSDALYYGLERTIQYYLDRIK